MAEIRQNMSEPCEKYQFVIYVFLYDLYMDGYDIYIMYTLYIYIHMRMVTYCIYWLVIYGPMGYHWLYIMGYMYICGYRCV